MPACTNFSFRCHTEYTASGTNTVSIKNIPAAKVASTVRVLHWLHMHVKDHREWRARWNRDSGKSAHSGR